MAEYITAADPEAAALAELAAAPAQWRSGWSFGTQIPATKPSKFVRLLVSGGTQRDLVTDRPTITVECYALKELDAADGARDFRAVLMAAAMKGSMGGVTCYAVETFGRPQNYPNPLVPTHKRYQFTISADLRMSAA